MKTFNRRVLLASAGAAVTTAAIAPRVFSHPHTPGDTPGAWLSAAAMPSPVQEIYPAAFWSDQAARGVLKPLPPNVIVNAGGLYAYGAELGISDVVTVFDPIADAWKFGPRLPEARHHIALVAHHGFLHGLGGFFADDRGNWQMRANNWRIDELDGQWSTMAPMPHSLAESVMVSLDGLIHVVGGRSPIGSRNLDWRDHLDTDEHWAYHSGENRWAPLAPLPTPRNSAAGAIVRGALYVIGGRTVSDGNLDVVEVYDPMSDRWNVAAPLPQASAGLAAATLDGKIYVFGGEHFDGGGGVYGEVWEYDPKEDKWRAAVGMPRPRHGLGAVTLDNAIYVIGGASRRGGNDTSAAVDVFMP